MVIDVVLRLQGPTIDSERLSWLPRERITKTWKKGDPRRGSAVSAESGLTLALSESADATQAMTDAGAVLGALAGPIPNVMAEGAQGEVDFGLMLDAEAPLAPGIRFDRQFLSLLERCGLELIVTMYPCSD